MKLGFMQTCSAAAEGSSVYSSVSSYPDGLPETDAASAVSVLFVLPVVPPSVRLRGVCAGKNTVD